MKYTVKIRATITTEVEAPTLQAARDVADTLVPAQFEPSLLSIMAEGVIAETVYEQKPGSGPDPGKPRPPSGRPNGGGSPGTPVLSQAVNTEARAA